MSEGLLSDVLVALVIMVAFARLGGIAFRAIGQPAVCGEIAAGLLLGPSVLGGFFPELSSGIFTAQTGEVLTMMSQVGLLLFLFLVGLDFEFEHLEAHAGKPIVISAVGMLLPFALGLGVGLLMQPHVAPDVPSVTFALFVALALSITSLPVLGRIMIEYGLNRTPLGVLTITSAALDDAFGWILLAFIVSVATTHADVGKSALMMVETIGYAAFLLFAARPWLIRWARYTIKRGGGEVPQSDLALLLVLVFGSALVTSQIGIFGIFGAFLMGAMLASEAQFRDAVLAKLSDFVTVFFLPIYFTYTGLRTDVGSMSGLVLWGFAALVVAAAIIGKLGGCTLAARAVGLPWRDAGMVGVMMNARALMALIVVNVGLDAGVLTETAFFMLVVMAVITTFMTGPLLKRLLSRASEDSLASRPDLIGSGGGWGPRTAASPAGSGVP